MFKIGGSFESAGLLRFACNECAHLSKIAPDPTVVFLVWFVRGIFIPLFGHALVALVTTHSDTGDTTISHRGYVRHIFRLRAPRTSAVFRLRVRRPSFCIRPTCLQTPPSRYVGRIFRHTVNVKCKTAPMSHYNFRTRQYNEKDKRTKLPGQYSAHWEHKK